MSGKKANGEGSIRKIEDRNVWEARYYIDGKRKSIYAKSKTEARNKMNDILAELRRDEYIDEQKMTLEEWLNIWFDEFLEVRPSSKARYERDIRLRIVPYLGHYRLKDLNTIAIQRMYRKCKSDGLSAKSVMNMHGVLHEALDKAVSLRYMKHNPSDDCTLPKRQKPQMKTITDKALPRFLQAIKGDRYEDIYYITIFTGLRESEAIGLTWDCVNFEQGTVRIYRQLVKTGSRDGKGVFEFTQLKNGKERTIEPPFQVMERLRTIKLAQAAMKLSTGGVYRNPQKFVFTNPDGDHIQYHTMYTHFKTIVASIGIPEARFHDLRHTYATLAIQNGSDIKTVSESLGHATVAFTMDRYGHVSNAMRRANSERMERLIAELN